MKNSAIKLTTQRMIQELQEAIFAIQQKQTLNSKVTKTSPRSPDFYYFD